jgi:hypothetical protein
MEGQKYINDPKEEPLTGPIGRAAVNGQLFSYPKIVRQRRDPLISGQKFSLLSFHLFSTPETLPGTNKKVLGFAKIRGTFATEEEAERKGAQLVREIDSTFHIGTCETGTWVPITDNIFDLASKKVTIHDQDSQELEELRKRDETNRKNLKEAREQQELVESHKRQKELIETDVHDNPDTLEYATMQATVWLKLFREREGLKLKLKNMTNKLKTQHEVIEYLRRRHPEFFEGDAWLTRANKDRRGVSLLDEVLSSEERKSFDKRIEQTRMPKAISRKPVSVVIDPEGRLDDPDNFDIIYPEYEEDYQLLEEDNEETRFLKSQNLKNYRDKLQRAEAGDRKAMAAVCPWKLDHLGRIKEGGGSAPEKLPPGTEDLKLSLPDPPTTPYMSTFSDPTKTHRQEVFYSGQKEENPWLYIEKETFERESFSLLEIHEAERFISEGDVKAFVILIGDRESKIIFWLKDMTKKFIIVNTPSWVHLPKEWETMVNGVSLKLVKTEDSMKVYLL